MLAAVKMPREIPWGWIGGFGVGALALAALASRRTGQLPGTLFTILFENKGRSQVLNSSSAPTFRALARTYADLQNYHSRYHPSLPNYIAMTSGSTHGIQDDAGPASHRIPGTANLAAQLDTAHIQWRAYGESMPRPCFSGDTNLYAVRHLPFLYYDYVTGNPAYCAQHIVPMTDLAADLAADRYRYMWLTPNMQNNMHDGPIAVGDRWLLQMLPRLMSSPGYRRGGAIFIMFDETEGNETTIPALIVSNLVRRGVNTTLFDHSSYLATVEDLLGLPRLPSTQNAVSMAPLFR
jgi:phosphatidylinositol-3-phosphatase